MDTYQIGRYRNDYHQDTLRNPRNRRNRNHHRLRSELFIASKSECCFRCDNPRGVHRRCRHYGSDRQRDTGDLPKC